MNAPQSHNSNLYSQLIPKPYCSVGAGPLSSFVWKTGDKNSGWRYQFNVFRLTARGGRVKQLFGPSELLHFVKLTQVLAAFLADDGCLSPVDRGVLNRLATDLDHLLKNASRQRPANDGGANGQATHP